MTTLFVTINHLKTFKIILFQILANGIQINFMGRRDAINRVSTVSQKKEYCCILIFHLDHVHRQIGDNLLTPEVL